LETGEGPVLNKTIEVPAVNRLGQEFPISLKISASQIEGRWYFIAFMNDLTNQKLSEENSRQAILELETAKEQGDLYKEFLSLASHELKTPITSIMALSQIAIREHERNNTASLYKSIEGISKHSRKLGMLINQLMDISRIQSGKLALDKIEVNLNEFLQQTVVNLQAIYPTHHLVLESEPDPILLELDPLRVEQVLNNLVGNAVKYSPTHSRVDLICRKNNNLVEIAVTDYGIGIESGLKHHVFDKFYQVDNILKADKSGLGVGLHIASEIIKSHGGSVWVESDPGVKTTFTFTLPLKVKPV
jgi:signal transduction histidine kinase